MSGIDLITAERERQVSVEGWTPEHDDKHDNGELAKAARVYAFTTQQNVSRTIEDPRLCGWPWDRHWFKPFGEPPPNDPTYENSFPVVDRIRCLAKAGALIAAEIDRLHRMFDCREE